MARPSPDPSYILRGASSAVTCLAFSTEETLYSGSQNGRVMQWSLSSRRSKAILDAHGDHTVLWVYPREDTGLITQGRDGMVKTWQYQNGMWTNTGYVHCASMGFCASALVSLNNTKLVTVPSDITSQVNIYDLQNKCHVLTLKPCNDQQKFGMCMSIKSIDRQSENSQILIGYENGNITLWDLRTAKCVDVLDNVHCESVMCMAVSSESKKGVSGSVDEKIASWIIQSDDSLKTSGETVITNPGLNDLVIRSDDRIVASAGWDSNVRLFGFKKMKPLALLSYHRESVQCLAFSPDNFLACGSKDQLISVWDVYR